MHSPAKAWEHPLERAQWDADAARDVLQEYGDDLNRSSAVGGIRFYFRPDPTAG